MTALAPSPVSAYLAEQISDELTLLPLLGWKNVQAPREITPNCWITGTHLLANGHAGRNAGTFCPRFRRTNDAFELIGPCQIHIAHGQGWVQATAPGIGSYLIDPDDHPTKDDAIRAAMCKAAIAYLSKERGA